MTKISFLLFATLALFAQSVSAQKASTAPAGAMTYSFNATTTATVTPLSIPLIATPVYTGKPSLVMPNALTVSGATWVSGSFALPSQPYFVRLATGCQAGRMMKVTANTATTLTLDMTDNSTLATLLTSPNWAVYTSDTFEIIAGDTLATLFGDNTTTNPLAFVAGTSELDADTVALFNKTTGLWDTYFFNSTLNAWTLKGDAVTTRNNTVIYPENGVLITQQASRLPSDFTVVGAVPNVAPLTKLALPASSIFANSRYPIDSSLNFSVWTKGTSALNSDTVSIYNKNTGVWDVYYQQISNGQWRLKGDTITDKSSTVISSGSVLGVTKRIYSTGASAFLKSTPMPYSLQ